MKKFLEKTRLMEIENKKKNNFNVSISNQQVKKILILTGFVVAVGVSIYLTKSTGS